MKDRMTFRTKSLFILIIFSALIWILTRVLYCHPRPDAPCLRRIRTKFLIPPRTFGRYNLSNSTSGYEYSEHNGTFQRILDFLGSEKPGFFIEAGAVDGETLSNTLNLEKDYNWTGLLIEPNPEMFEKLKNKRRKAWAANVCLSDTSKEKNMTFEFHQSNPFISRKQGLRNVYDDQWKNAPRDIVNVTCLPIFSMLKAIHVSTVDFFSLDVEGFELRVLKTIPFDQVFIKIFLIEQNDVRDERIPIFMKEKGYIRKPFLRSYEVDHLFIHSSLESSQLSKLESFKFRVKNVLQNKSCVQFFMILCICVVVFKIKSRSTLFR